MSSEFGLFDLAKEYLRLFGPVSKGGKSRGCWFFVAGGAALQISYLLDGFRRYNGKYGDSQTPNPKVLYHLQKSELNLSG